MAFSLTGDRPGSFIAAHSWFSSALSWLARVKVGRARKMSLTALLELDQSRLGDLGINRDDVLEALRHPCTSGQILSARRACNAVAPIAPVQ